MIKKYFIKKYNVSKEVEEEFEIMYHRKKFGMAFKWGSYSEAVDSFTFLKEKDKANAKLWMQKMFIRYPFLHSSLKKIKKLYVPKTAASQI